MRPRNAILAALCVLALVLAVRWSGWTPVAREPLPASEYAPTTSDDPRDAQTLAHETFEAGGGRFAWEVVGAAQMGSGLHALRYQIQRLGGDEARVWPTAALLLDARGYHVGEAPLGGGPHREGDALVLSVGYQPPAPGTRELTAVLELEVVREAPIGYVKERPVERHLTFRVEAAPLRPTSEGPS
ncbi:MAG TPA: hypothetical protein VM582_03190 [Candidatus Thermoplasmatota archaeon]|nr:hypothetical protein [Candidatus Thermoplasmatota archaeon]